MNEFKEVVFGTLTLGSFAGYFLYAIMGAAAQIFMEAKERDKDSKRTPFKFSWKFLVSDNIWRVLVTIIFIFLSFRLYEEINNTPLTAFGAFNVGLGLDRLSQLFKKKRNVIKDYAQKLLNTKDNGNIS